MKKLIVAIALSAGNAAAQSAPALPPVKIVTAAWLADHLHDPKVAVIQVEMDAKGAAAIIEGAHVIPYDDIVVNRDGLSTELPPAEKLRAIFEAAGVSDSTLVVLTSSHQAPMASRGLVSLDYLGHTELAMLDGAIAGWRAEKRPTSKASAPAAHGHITTRVRTDLVVDAPWISARIGKPGLALIDTRSDGEYLGTGDRHGMPSAGHLAGAKQLQWEQLFKDPDATQFKSRGELAKLYADRMNAGDTVVTYCWIGFRASMTYTAARMLGLPAKFYDGSYQDWQIRKLPVVPGEKP